MSDLGKRQMLLDHARACCLYLDAIRDELPRKTSRWVRCKVESARQSAKTICRHLESTDMNDQGCQDGNCILRIGPMVGQHTNAGCQCLSRLPVSLRQAIERKIQTQHREIEKLKAEVAGL